MKYSDWHSSPNGYRAVFYMSEADIKVIIPAINAAIPKARSRADKLYNKLRRTGKSQGNVTRLKVISKELHYAREKLEYLNKLRAAGRLTKGSDLVAPEPLANSSPANPQQGDSNSVREQLENLPINGRQLRSNSKLEYLIAEDINQILALQKKQLQDLKAKLPEKRLDVAAGKHQRVVTGQQRENRGYNFSLDQFTAILDKEIERYEP